MTINIKNPKPHLFTSNKDRAVKNGNLAGVNNRHISKEIISQGLEIINKAKKIREKYKNEAVFL